MQITFLGATGTVTGSKYLLETVDRKILVDCGLFQGYKALRQRNWEKLPIDPKTIDAVLLTHAHIDHSGYIPVLIKNGFQGPIYCSKGTRDLCSILLPDSGHLQEEEAHWANKKGYSKHKPALPLYTRLDAEKSLEQFHPVDFAKDYRLSENLMFHFNRVGHIVGAASLKVKFDNRSIVFSGDVGRLHDPVMEKPVAIQSADYLVLESTYGDRLHEESDPKAELAEIINRTIKRNGKIIVPAFAVGRAQLLLYYLYHLKEEKLIPNIPVFLDSPLAIKATKIFSQNINGLRLSKKEIEAICASVTCTSTPDESKKIDEYKTPIVVISASGMAVGGRVLHHLAAYVSDPRNTILFTGFQAAGTRGDQMLRGEPQIKMHGALYPVKAEVALLTNMSAHADYREILTWLSHLQKAPAKLFITHGEENAALSLKEKIEHAYHWTCEIPEYLQTETI